MRKPCHKYNAIYPTYPLAKHAGDGNRTDKLGMLRLWSRNLLGGKVKTQWTAILSYAVNLVALSHILESLIL